MDQWQSEGRRPVQQRPQLLGFERRQVYRPFGGVAVHVAAVRLPCQERRVQLTEQREVVLAIAAIPDRPGVEPAPVERAVHPATTRARPHDPCHQARCAMIGIARVGKAQLDRQRVTRRRRSAAGQQRAKWSLPWSRVRSRRRCLARRCLARRCLERLPIGGQRGGWSCLCCVARPRAGSEYGGDDMLAVDTDRAAALALDKRNPVAIIFEVGGRRVDRAVPHHRGRQRVLVLVPERGQHSVLTRIPGASIECRRAETRVEIRDLNIAQAPQPHWHGSQPRPLSGRLALRVPRFAGGGVR